MNKDQIIKQLRDMAKHPTVTLPRDCEALRAAADLLAQPEQDGQCKRCTDGCPACDARRLPEQEPVAMKFKIYKPTAPDPVRQGINNALLPWVYDQDRSSGFDASMWVTPVATLPPQRKPLTDEQAMDAYCETPPFGTYKEAFIAGIRFIEAAHGIKE